MIIEKEIYINVHTKNKKLYKDNKIGDKVKVKVSDLPKGSNVKIKVRCDNDECSKEKEISYYDYNSATKHLTRNYYCTKCSHIHTKKSLKEKYGVENVMQLKDVIDKHKESVNNVDFKEADSKRRKTNIEKYGVEYVQQNKEINKKTQDTINEKYGVDFSFLQRCYTSKDENLIKDYIKELGIYFIDTDKTILTPKHLDIYIPNYNLAIEFNGLYWHSELKKDKYYHLNKTNGCESKNIQLLHIFEDDWVYKQNIIKSIIRNKLGLIKNKIYARKCVIKEVKSNIARQFLDQNHIQGFSNSTYKLGLYYQNELVSLMTFGYRRTNTKKEFELIRFCNKLNTNIVGSSSKLFKHFIKNYDIEESYILSYADASLFDGNMYKILGFDYIHRTKPNYFWVVDKKREHRFKYNKQKLIKEGFDSNKTEAQIMHQRGYYRIYGVGQDRYEYHIISK